MGCCCNDKKTDKGQTPDCMASKSTVVTTPEGEDVEVHFNMGTGEVTYSQKTPSDKAVAVVQSRGKRIVFGNGSKLKAAPKERRKTNNASAFLETSDSLRKTRFFIPNAFRPGDSHFPINTNSAITHSLET